MDTDQLADPKQCAAASRAEADSVRHAAIFGVCLATMASLVCTLSIPLAALHFQQLSSQMQAELHLCPVRGGNIMQEVLVLVVDHRGNFTRCF